MQTVFKQIALASTSDVPVLITGESGAGKELVAHAIHAHSRRKEGPYVPVCLAALSPTVVESELFGHVKGAYTGADFDRAGLLAMAHRGTVLLDEIGDVPLSVQVKLLRAIELREVTPVGDTRSRQADFRVLAATNRSLSQLVAAGEFREDLYYRLGVFHIEVPPLRNRTDDIPALARFFLSRLQKDDRDQQFSTAALQELRSRSWQGNVRELKNAVEHAATVARGSLIQVDHLPPPLTTGRKEAASTAEQLRVLTTTWLRERIAEHGTNVDSAKLYEDYLQLVEPVLFEAALLALQHNRTATARILGLHRTTLRQKLREYKLDNRKPR